MITEEIGSISTILTGIKTKIDGSVEIKLEANPSEQEVINKLLNKYLVGEKLFQIGIISIKNPNTDDLKSLDLDFNS